MVGYIDTRFYAHIDGCDSYIQTAYTKGILSRCTGMGGGDKS